MDKMIKLNINFKLILIFFILSTISIIHLFQIYTTDLMYDEPGYNLNALSEILYVLRLSNQPIGLDIVHGFTFEIFGSIFSCIQNIDFCNFNNIGGDKNLFWNEYYDFLINVRLLLIFINLMGSLAISFTIYLLTNRFNGIIYSLILINLFPMWNALKVFQSSDFIPVVGFTLVIYYLISNAEAVTPNIKFIKNLGQHPITITTGIFLIIGSRFPLVILAFILILLYGLVYKFNYWNLIQNKSFYFFSFFFVIVFIFTNFRLVEVLYTNPFDILDKTINFDVNYDSINYNFSTPYSALNPPAWYLVLHFFSRLPLVFILLILILLFANNPHKKNISFLHLNFVILTLFPILIQILFRSTLYDTGRQFFFTFLPVIYYCCFSITLFKDFNVKNFLYKRVLNFSILFFTLVVLADQMMLDRYVSIYRNEIIRLLGSNAIENDYLGISRFDASKKYKFNNKDKIYVLESEWLPPSDRLYFEKVFIIKNIDLLPKNRFMNDYFFVYRPVIPKLFIEFEKNYPYCSPIESIKTGQLGIKITLAKIYSCKN